MNRNNRDLSYTERDYEGLKDQLEILAEKYFPSTFKDFSDYSIETMIMEMVAYTGDVLNFYMDDRFRQNFAQYVDDPESIYRLAKSRGHNPVTVNVAFGEVELSQLTTATLDGGEYIPNLDDCATIRSNSYFSDVSRTTLYTLIDNVDMSKYDRYEVVEETNDVPVLFRVYKKAKVRSGERKTKRIEVGSSSAYPEYYIDDDVAFIISVEDSDDNHWYQVDFLSQDTIFEKVDIENFSEEYNQYKDQTPFILKSKKVSRRYVIDNKSDGKSYIKFGSGIDNIDNSYKNLSTEDLLTTNQLSMVDESQNFSIESFLNYDSFGLRPTNTTLNVVYVKSNGEEENVNSNSVRTIVNMNATFPNVVSEDIEESFEVINPDPIIGGSYNEINKVKSDINEALYTQRRCVTIKDYIIRSKLMPPSFGKIEKVFAERSNDEGAKAVNLYTLSKNIDGHLTNTNIATKENLSRYLQEFKIASDRVNIIDPFIINIGVEFEFLSKSGYNNDQVLLNISRKVEQYFNINNREINQPILIGELIQEMDSAEGVVMVTNIQIVNKHNSENGYSPVKYDTSVNGENYDEKRRVIYPPLDVGIFEMRYPTIDIIGKPS